METRRKRRARGGQFLGLCTYDLVTRRDLSAEAVRRELAANPEALAVVLNVQAQRRPPHYAASGLSWGRRDGPFRLRSETAARGVFHALRLGMIQIEEASVFAVEPGKRRKTIYRLPTPNATGFAKRLLDPTAELPRRVQPMWRPDWREYCPAFPGLFLLCDPRAPASWKKLFTAGGMWREEVTASDRRRAPTRQSGKKKWTED